MVQHLRVLCLKLFLWTVTKKYFGYYFLFGNRFQSMYFYAVSFQCIVFFVGAMFLGFFLAGGVIMMLLSNCIHVSSLDSHYPFSNSVAVDTLPPLTFFQMRLLTSHADWLLMNKWQFHLLNWQDVGLGVGHLCILLFTVFFVWAYPQSHRLDLTCCSKYSLLLAFFFVFVCVYQSQMRFLSVSTLLLFQGIICNVERQKGYPRALNYWWDLNWRGKSQTPLNTML